jgi:chromosome segregation protein
MRLEKIKLAGFKSFVDPTTVSFPSNLVAVVGPNGCGKSNVIDAVRWVMGESSARMLRGESMADVIFNGSSARKPVGQAVIELVFDNSDGGAGGQYAKYNQVSIKRQVSRDGQSAYFLNGTRCRRRDITDLFLGTGLGPRSYSIIEQGTISRLIEARPEELRMFLEEAAGISKYKERRRETENRIRHTRENLDRLDDLREEVAKHLQHLERQAATAERYKTLREQERRLKAELLALRWRTLDEELVRRGRGIAELEIAVEAALADQRHLEAELEENRQRQHEVAERFNEVQGRFYANGAEIARIEQTLQFNRDNRRRQEQELTQVARDFAAVRTQSEQDQARLRELRLSLTEREPELARLQVEEELHTATLDEADAAMQRWQTEWEEFNRGAAEPAQRAQVERTRINHLEQQLVQHERRLSRLAEERGRLDDPQLQQLLARLEESEGLLGEELETQRDRLESAHGRIRSLRTEQGELSGQLDDLKDGLQQARGRRASLAALQEAGSGGESSDLKAWLARHALDQTARLADHLEAKAPWGRAAEMVLGAGLHARCVDSLDRHAAALGTLADGPLHLFEAGRRERVSGSGLQAFVKAPWSLDGLLGGVGVANDLADALARRHELGPGESLVTPEGVWVGPDWLQVPGREPAGGVLERVGELKALERDIGERELEVETLQHRLSRVHEALDEAEAERTDAQARLDRINRELGRLHSDLSARRTRREHLLHRGQAIAVEETELCEQAQADRESMAEARERLHAALESMENLAQRRDALVVRRDELRAVLDAARDGARAAAERSRRLGLEVEAARTARASLAAGQERLVLQLAQLEERQGALQQALEAADAPLGELEQALERELARRVTVERELAEAREQVASVEAALRAGEQSRHGAEQAVQGHRSELDLARLQRQEVLVRGRTLEEQLKADGFEAARVLAQLPADADEVAWQEEAERVAGRIQRLGAVNLAAIDELKEETERKRYLDAQYTDITRSLETLEEAIRKIDRETRTRFKETFDKVNGGLQTLFPRLFGGGHAYLELTGEDLLDTGVSIMARPPGKRNSSIHLLSGGEKALTAVALVFSIFQLNPAPFCMLDEVDAPLDDANVGRFCELVKSMADQVQFIFITHNKVTMELANQLTGVTMHEPGVSRLVSVDVDEAVQLAAV